MTRVGILTVVVLVAAGLGFLTHIWNPTENGPNLPNPSAFLGCYESASNKLIITQETITVAKTRQSARIVRFFYLKNDAAIEMVNNLRFDTSGNDLSIGDATTGFFYTFDSWSKPSALLIPDDGGNVRKLSRVPC